MERGLLPIIIHLTFDSEFILRCGQFLSGITSPNVFFSIERCFIVNSRGDSHV
jgi:hypothetical protein